MTGKPDVAWRRLGEMLLRRREELDSRFAGRGGLTLFAEERGLNRRVAWDIENAKRTNYTRAMLRDIEGAYGLERWAIDKFLAMSNAEADAGDLSPAERELAAAMWAANYDEDGPVFSAAELRAFIARTILSRRERPAPARDGEQRRVAG